MTRDKQFQQESISRDEIFLRIMSLYQTPADKHSVWGENNIVQFDNGKRIGITVGPEVLEIPSAEYPLAGKCSIFCAETCKQVSDEKVLAVFDSVPYRTGHCYQNTQSLVSALRENDIYAVPYAGWLFCGEGTQPIFHCWCVVDGNSVLDLSDEFLAFQVSFDCRSKHSRAAVTGRLAEFRRYVNDSNMVNRYRCAPVGVPYQQFLYVGSPCTPEYAAAIYQELMRAFPQHKSIRKTSSGDA